MYDPRRISSAAEGVCRTTATCTATPTPRGALPTTPPPPPPPRPTHNHRSPPRHPRRRLVLFPQPGSPLWAPAGWGCSAAADVAAVATRPPKPRRNPPGLAGEAAAVAEGRGEEDDERRRSRTRSIIGGSCHQYHFCRDERFVATNTCLS